VIKINNFHNAVDLICQKRIVSNPIWIRLGPTIFSHDLPLDIYKSNPPHGTPLGPQLATVTMRFNVLAALSLAAVALAQGTPSGTATAPAPSGSVPPIPPCVLGCTTTAATAAGCAMFVFFYRRIPMYLYLVVQH
jgi:hypothetical protein